VLRTRACWSTLDEMLPPGAELIAKDAIRPLKRVEYDRLAAEGFFQDEKVELLFGVVVVMTPIDQSHNMSVYQVRRGLEAGLRERAMVFSQSSFAASDDSEPEPDVFVIPNDAGSWTELPSRSLLVVEIARSSVARDQGPKSLLYGSCSVDEYWIVLPEQVVEVYREPDRVRWRSKSIHHRGARVHMLAFPDVSIAVDDVLPPPA
jgi:Uma2 family endonuclease